MRRFIFALIAVIAVPALGCGEQHYAAVPPTPAVIGVYPGITHANYVPAGSPLVLRANRAIQAETGAPGRVFKAGIVEPVLNSRGEVLIPRGAQAQLSVAEAPEAAGKLQLVLRSIVVDGERYIVRIAPEPGALTDEEEARGGRRATMLAGGGAVLGTLVSAVPAGAEMSAGTTAQAVTSGERIDVPANTILTFRLDEPIMLQGYGR